MMSRLDTSPSRYRKFARRLRLNMNGTELGHGDIYGYG